MTETNSKGERALAGARGKSLRAPGAVFFLAPFLIFFAIFVFAPMLWGAYISLTRYQLLSVPVFVGLRNYIQAVHDPIFLRAVRNTCFYVLGVLPISFLSLTMALAFSRVRAGQGIYRAILFLPYVIPMAAHAFIWTFIFQPDVGALSAIFALLGFRGVAHVPWLMTMGTALPAVLLVWVYVYTGYFTSIYYAGLQQIPRTYYESAMIDGASSLSQFWCLTIPLLNNISLYVTVTATILAFQIFPLVYVLTGSGFGLGAGGPRYATISIDLYVFQSAFRDQQLGYATALGFLMLLLTVAIAWGLMRLLPEVTYE